ncbi:small rab-related gtpase [Anaeramoeba ignava]|uniref:Small rab-related gtpase n=1 Tax=Anaeramoeba ignava TaxID=1746090 RepID=A0A9Q0LDA0_ANAIG|nr:small rab-related gtpase [Anaeramoeba ignava]
MNKKKDPNFLIKILLLGDFGVGKTNFISCYILYSSHNSTIGVDFQFSSIEIDGELYKIQFFEIAGGERFRQITATYYKWMQGIIILYDATNQDSFDHLKYWFESIQKNANDDISLMIIGTKSDLVSEKAVDTEVAKNFADQLGISFFETSAKKNENIQESIQTFLKQLKKKATKITKENTKKKNIKLK